MLLREGLHGKLDLERGDFKTKVLASRESAAIKKLKRSAQELGEGHETLAPLRLMIISQKTGQNQPAGFLPLSILESQAPQVPEDNAFTMGIQSI